MTVVLVSMFFHLNQARPKSFYLTNGRDVLTLDAPLVLFCDAETRHDLEEIRGDRPTVYIEAPIASYDYYRTLLPIVRANRTIRPSPDPRNTPEYFLLSVFKFYALQVAWLRADFPATHYMWIDIGCSHIVRGIPSAIVPILSAPRPKIGCCYIHYRSARELYPIKNYFNSGGKCGIAAGILTLEASYVPRLFALANSILYEQILEGVGHAEEQILIYCYDRRPEWFSIYAGDYSSLATNYHRVVDGEECVRANFISRALEDGRPDLARAAWMRLLVLIISGGDNPVYGKHKEVWRSYMHKTPGVDVYFLESGTPGITEDTVTCAGTESWANILGKTLDALKLLPIHKYTYILRANLSSVWNFPRLLEHIETFPRTGVYAGVHGIHDNRIPFVSGAGILMTPDMCHRLLAHEESLRASPYPDDVAIGEVLTYSGHTIPRISILNPRVPIPPNGIHYRVKMEEGDSRDHEPDIMQRIVHAGA